MCAEGLRLCLAWAWGWGSTLEPAPGEEGPAWAGQEGTVRWTGCRRRWAARGLLEGGFVWVVISGPSWEPLMIRKSNKQGNPVFHTQPWPRPERLCVSSSPPLGAAVSYGILEGGKFSLHPPQSSSSVLLVQLGRQHTRPSNWFCRQRSTESREEWKGWGGALAFHEESRAFGESTGPVPRGHGVRAGRKPCI